MSTWNPLFIIHALFPFLRCRVLQVGYSRAHSTGLSWTSVWANVGQLQTFLKSFPTFIITIYPLLLLEFLTTLDPSLPPYRLVFFRTFSLKLNYNLIHTKRNSCKKKDMKQLCRDKEVLMFLKASGKCFLVLSWQELLEIPIHAPFTTGPEDAPQRNSGSLTTGKRQEKLLCFERGKGGAAWNKVSSATL